MGATRRGAVATAGLLLALLAAQRGSCHRGRGGAGEATRAVGAAQRFRHVLGLKGQGQAFSAVPQTPGHTHAPRGAPPLPGQHAQHSVEPEAVRFTSGPGDEPGTGGRVPAGPADPGPRGRPKRLPSPEAPRVPAPPSHLPPGLASRLKEFPSVAADMDGAPLSAPGHAFFDPRIQVTAPPRRLHGKPSQPPPFPPPPAISNNLVFLWSLVHFPAHPAASPLPPAFHPVFLFSL